MLLAWQVLIPLMVEAHDETQKQQREVFLVAMCVALLSRWNRIVGKHVLGVPLRVQRTFLFVE